MALNPVNYETVTTYVEALDFNYHVCYGFFAALLATAQVTCEEYQALLTWLDTEKGDVGING